MSALIRQQEWGLYFCSPHQTYIQQGIEYLLGNNSEYNKDHLNANEVMKDNQRWIYFTSGGVRREQEHPAGQILFTEKYFNYDLQLQRNLDPKTKVGN